MKDEDGYYYLDEKGHKIRDENKEETEQDGSKGDFIQWKRI